MSRTVTKAEYRVEVYPKHPGDFGGIFIGGMSRPDDETRAMCEEIARQVKRHVDGVGSASVAWTTVARCEFCGSTWTEGKDALHNGGCCDRDLAVADEIERADQLEAQ